jgi:hypothetical protein
MTGIVTDPMCTVPTQHCCNHTTGEFGTTCVCSDSPCGANPEVPRCDDPSVFDCATGSAKTETCGINGKAP